MIEVFIVVAIFGMVLYAFSIGLGPAGQAEIVKTTNQIAATIRFAYNRARVDGGHYRMVFDFEKHSVSLQQGDERMYLPATDRDGRIVEVDERREEEKQRLDEQAEDRFRRSIQNLIAPNAGTPSSLGAGPGGGQGLDTADTSSEEPFFDPYAVAQRKVPRRRPPLFDSFKSESGIKGMGEPVQLPSSIKLISVRTDADVKAIDSGEAYLYFFPMGRTQIAHILLSDDDEESAYTISVAPLTGKVTIRPELIPLKLPEDKNGGVDDLGREIERRSLR